MSATSRLVSLAPLILMVMGCISPAEPHNTRGVALFSAGQFEAARAEFLEAVAKDSVSADGYYNLGSTYHRMGDPGEAERNLVHCLALDPNHSKAHHALTVLLLEGKRTAEAYDHVNQWIAQSPGHPDPMVELAWLERQAGRTEQSRQLLYQVLAANPKHARGLTELASIYESSNDSERALALYERALEANPDHPELSGRVTDLRAVAKVPGIGNPIARVNDSSQASSKHSSRDLRYQLR
jgi:tetratricopeptide (TPR) repeat protein